MDTQEFFDGIRKMAPQEVEDFVDQILALPNVDPHERTVMLAMRQQVDEYLNGIDRLGGAGLVIRILTADIAELKEIEADLERIVGPSHRSWRLRVERRRRTLLRQSVKRN